MRRVIEFAVCIALSLIFGVCAEECYIRYLQQPPSVLECNPYGSVLQLQCTAIGPSSTVFHVTWYSSEESSSGLTRLSSEDGVSIQNVELINSDLRTSSSTLMTSIEEGDEGLCFWCEIEYDMQESLRSNALCILSTVEYTGMVSCSQTGLLTNGTEVCANTVVAGRNSGLQITPTLTEPLPSMTAYSMTTPSPQVSMATKMPPGNTASSSGSDDRNLDGLYGAVATCVVLVVLIAILTVIIVILCKRKYRGNTVSHTVKLTTTGSDHNTSGGSRVMRNAFSEPPDTHPATEKGILLSSRLDTGRATSEPDMKTVVGHDHTSVDTPEGEQCDYDHLQPVYAITTKERFYYTLEATGECIIPSNGKKPMEDFADYEEIAPPPCSLSLPELFDDPKYAALFVAAQKKRADKTRRAQSLSPVHSIGRKGNYCSPSARSQQELSTFGSDGQGRSDRVVVAIEIHEA